MSELTIDSAGGVGDVTAFPIEELGEYGFDDEDLVDEVDPEAEEGTHEG